METPRPLLRMPVLEALAEIRRRFSAAAAALAAPSRPAPAPRPAGTAAHPVPQVPLPPAQRPPAPDLLPKYEEYLRRTDELLRRHGISAVAKEWAREIAPVRDLRARLGAVARHPAVARAMSKWTPPDDPHVRFAVEYCVRCGVPPKAFYLDAASLRGRAAFLEEARRGNYCRPFHGLATGDDPENDEEADPLGQMLREYDRNHPVTV